MKTKLIQACIILAFCLIFPTAFTLFFNGDKHNTSSPIINSGKSILITNDSSTVCMDMEEFIPCVLACQISINSPIEAIKAQAIVIRTYILKHMGTSTKIEADSLELPFILYDEMKDLLQEDYSNYHTTLKKAVSDTSGKVIKYNGQLITPYFHAISVGKTRSGKEALNSDQYPYLISKESTNDVNAKDYVTISYIDKEVFINALKKHSDSLNISTENPLENMQVLKRCSAGYIASIQLGDQTFTGDEIQMLLNLKSPYFELETFENQIRIITKGNGHGLGLSIYGACEMANNKSTCNEILTYYYDSVSIEK